MSRPAQKTKGCLFCFLKRVTTVDGSFFKFLYIVSDTNYENTKVFTPKEN